MRLRVPLAFLVTVASCLAFTPSAWACPTTTLALDQSAGPGDTVSYSIAGIVPGATYSFTIAGQEISGKNTSSTDNGVSGTFTMPDLGSQALTLTANGSCSCPDSADNPGLHGEMQYLPPPPAAPPSSGPSQGSESKPAPAIPVGNSQEPTASAKPHAPTASPSHPAAAPSAQSSGSGAQLGTEVAAPQAVSTPSDSAAQAQAKTEERRGKASSSVPGRVLDTIGGTTSVGPAKVPTLGLVMIALMLITGLGLAGLAIYILRNGPDPNAAVREPAPTGPDPIEAELQEIIADEMAKKLLTDLDLVKPPVGSS
jgi:hypothetical protein